MAQCSQTTPAQQALCAAAAADGAVNTIVSNYGTTNVALQQLSTQSDIQLNTTVISSPAAQRAQIACGAAKRNGVERPGCAAEGTDAMPSRSAKAGSIGGVGISVTGSWAQAEQDTAHGQTGFKANSPGIVVAADAVLAPKLLAGVALGFQQGKMDFEFQGSDSGHLDSNTVRAMAYLNYALSQTAYAEAAVGYGRSSFDSERVCSACSVLATRNTASFSGDEYLLSVGAGNGYKLRDVSLGAFVRADYLHFRTDSYAEDGPKSGNLGRTALEVDAQSVNSFTGVLGGQFAYTAFRSRITPRARIEWVHEFADGSRTITSRFRDASSTTIGFATASPERNWVNVGLGLDVASAGAWSLHFDYAHLFKRDASADQISARFRYNF
jgi:uncharacterized protein with beta-barrel porin domain